MRVLFAIGCDSYEHEELLQGAERDAQRIYDLLIRPDVGDYDSERSCLLLSPTYGDVHKALKTVLFTGPKIQTFTFFFAGHGSVSTGAFYMWLQDSNRQGLSMSGLSLADVFRAINDAAPLQSNIIIDACESGGLIEDLGSLLKPGLFGSTGSPGLTLFATAAQDQGAGDTADGGIGTIALLECIEGKDFVQDHNSTLDLVEIGMRVSERLRTSGQSPVVWGLNLFGVSGFCKNPRFGSDPATPLRQALQEWPTSSTDTIRQNYDALWSTYSAVSGVWSSKKFSDVVRTVLSPSSSEPDVLATLAARLAVTFLQKAIQARDPFRSVEVSATLAVALLSYLEHPSVIYTAQRLLNHTCLTLQDAVSKLIVDLEENKYALLSDRWSAFGELYELPLRLTKLLGWTAAAVFISQNDGFKKLAEDQFSKVVRLILEHYSGSLVSINDAQASGLCIALSACGRLGLRDEGEQLAGHYFNSLVQSGCKVARTDIPPERVLEYLLARRRNNFSGAEDLIARPIDMLSILLKAASLFDLEDIFDESFWKIDNTTFTAYLPKNYADYGMPIMGNGVNLVWSIGFDVFRTSDFLSSWPTSKTIPKNPLEASLALTATLLYPDRQAWFLLE